MVWNVTTQEKASLNLVLVVRRTRQIAKLVLESLQTGRRRTEETCAYISLDESKIKKISCDTCLSDKSWFIKSSKVCSGRQAHRITEDKNEQM